MIYLYTGTDREKALAAMNKAITRESKKAEVTLVSDASTAADVAEALRGSGMFGLPGQGEKRLVVLDGVFANEEMGGFVLDALPHMKSSDEVYFVLEGKLDAATRKTIEKHSDVFERFDTKKEKAGGEIFSLVYALKGGDKKRLWVEYQRAVARGDAPGGGQGGPLWGGKDNFLKASPALRA